MSSSPETHKRPHSASSTNNKRDEPAVDEPPSKRQRSHEGDAPEKMTSNGGGTSKLPRIPKVKRDNSYTDQRQSRPAIPAEHRGPSYREQRDRHGDERPRNYDQLREKPRNRSKSPGRQVHQAYRRRSPPRTVRRDPSPISRSPSPIRNDAPRNVPRPGGGTGRGRNLLAERNERERNNGYAGPTNNGVQSAVNTWYNAVPEYGKERGLDWRRTQSQIKGLRSFNNWVKSCIIQKFSPQEKPAVQAEELGWGETAKEPDEVKDLLVLDIGCGKGGDLGKWEKCPQRVGLYVGLDPADKSIEQAQDRYKTMWRGRRPRYEARFAAKDCFGEWIGDLPIIRDVGIDPHPESMNRWGTGGGFDVVSMMFSMHYSFESQAKVETMLKNVAGALKKGGRFIGVCPNSDVLSDGVKNWFKKNPTPSTQADGRTTQPSSRIPPGAAQANGPPAAPSWGNSIYSVTFPPASTALPALASDGSFRPAFGHKYIYYIAEAVDVPEFVVPWEGFRAIAENYGLEQRYRKGFLDIWNHETDPERATNTGVGASGASAGGWGEGPSEVGDATAAVARELEQLGVRMGVVKHAGGPLQMSEEEKEAVAFYHAFCFVKT